MTTPMPDERDVWIEQQAVKLWRILFVAGRNDVDNLICSREIDPIKQLLRDAMACADQHPLPLKRFERPAFPVEPMDDSDSLEQPSPLRVVDSEASDGTASTPPPEARLREALIECDSMLSAIAYCHINLDTDNPARSIHLDEIKQLSAKIRRIYEEGK